MLVGSLIMLLVVLFKSNLHTSKFDPTGVRTLDDDKTFHATDML